jgi:general secretion pathway protein A
MYLQFFGLTEKPFAITPDPRYLYLSARHADALAHLVYGINEAGGFIQLTGEVGTGKTTTIRSLLAQAPKNAEIALILNPRLSATEFLRALCEELGLAADGSFGDDTKALVDLLNRYLLRAHARGQRVVLIVDEAQNLAPDVLEQVRLLTNLETETHKLLQIILIGQPELRKLLAREDCARSRSASPARYHLEPLSREETCAYVRHRLRVAGATADCSRVRRCVRSTGQRRHPAPDQCALRSGPARRLHPGPAPGPGQLVRRAGAEVFGHGARATLDALALACLAVGRAVWQRGDCSGRHAPAQRCWQFPSGPSTRASYRRRRPHCGWGCPAHRLRAAMRPRPALECRRCPPSGPHAALAQLLALRTPTARTRHRLRCSCSRCGRRSYVPGGTDGCSQALSQGLQCLLQRGSLAQLRLLNRPGHPDAHRR